MNTQIDGKYKYQEIMLLFLLLLHHTHGYFNKNVFDCIIFSSLLHLTHYNLLCRIGRLQDSHVFFFDIVWGVGKGKMF